MLDLTQPGDLAFALAPDLLLMVGSMLLLLWAAWRPESAQHQRAVGIASMALVVLVAGAVVVLARLGLASSEGVVAVDGFRWMMDLVVLIGTMCALALSIDYNAREGLHSAESHVLLLLAAAGAMLLAAARDLIIVFLGIELMSIAVYVLVGLNRRSARSAEGALKYFLLGAFSTAFLLYGIALVYGATGTTSLPEIGAHVSSLSPPMALLLPVGVGLLLVGFGFKIAAAPFHMWAPDVYEGAPTPITAFMAAAVKAAAFAAFARVWIEAFGPLWRTATWWHAPIFWLAVGTMVVGNAVALAQRNIKRILAYSSIAHAGYLLVAIAAGTPAGISALLFYTLAYTLATMGAFAVVIALGHAGERDLNVDDFAGLWTERPTLAVAMAIFMLALLGFPLFGGMGFIAKWAIVQAVANAPIPRGAMLAIVLALTSVVSAGYYMYVVLVMFMRPRPSTAIPTARVPGPTQVVITLTATLLLFFGVFPALALFQANRSTLRAPPSVSAPAQPPTTPPR